MKFSSIFAISLSVLPVFGAAVPAEERALEARLFGSEIVGSLNRVKAAVQNVDTAATKIKSADINAFLALNDASTKLSTTLDTETAYVAKQKKLDLGGALAVQTATGNLIDAVKKLVDDLIAIKKYADGAGVTAVVLQVLKDSKTKSDKFADTLTTKVPDGLTLIATYDKQQIDAALTKGIKAYGG